jgi:hypothetical protein
MRERERQWTDRGDHRRLLEESEFNDSIDEEQEALPGHPEGTISEGGDRRNSDLGV